MNTNISLSFELILLARWLMKHEKQQMSALIKQALENGFMQELESKSHKTYTQIADKFYENILEFLIFLEDALIENLAEFNLDEITNNAMIPLIKKLDISSVDIKTLWDSMQQAKRKISKEDNVQEHPERVDEVLFEHILKNWKPNKKLPLN